MASRVGSFCAKNYQNLIIGFHVTVENVGDVFLGHSVERPPSVRPYAGRGMYRHGKQN